MKFLDPGNPFYRPLWRRVVIVAVCLGWAAVEFSRGANAWGALFLAAGLFAAWSLLIAWRPDDKG
ncbi:DUF3329 domain-containing protein [Halovulum dunhuangense]|uniref:DUF3329 domain-containing protein n=1 Tax=Halovulum dunhuangense TaxID=1505036 RepID=A0A849L3W7_9RHOB|nr:DUF3329 domain-containing protein [Halovulum dunhuangense]NNU80851.1 DUF3329 domain-containing protein [Halovulum dunhuangense]